MQVGVNYPNNDLLSEFKVRSRLDCCALCRMDQDCWAWTTYQPLSGTTPLVCWLKSRAGTAVPSDAATVSGLVTR